MGAMNASTPPTANALAVPRLRAPLVLVHGLFGFHRLRVGGWTVANYFGDLPAFLQAGGNRVLVAQMHPTGGVPDRAAELKAFLDREVPREPVHLFAHSMGGLDSRYLISRLGMAPRILTLTTLGTPHRGSAFADWVVHRLAWLFRPTFQALGQPDQAFFDLTTSACRTFNETIPDAPGVRYFSVAGRHVADWLRPEWHLSHPILTRLEGPNDGLVSVESATYGEQCDVWDGDHVSLVNWQHPLEWCRRLGPRRKTDYAALVRRLADLGY
jgi:triacylglycerol lipase